MVYLIDNDDSVRKALHRLLQSVGFDVKAFSSVEEFFKGLDLSQRGCLILDIRVPGLTGFNLQKKLASEGVRIPAIAISAFDDGETRERARELGATAFFRKPVDGQALVDAIHWAVGIAKDRPGTSGS